MVYLLYYIFNWLIIRKRCLNSALQVVCQQEMCTLQRNFFFFYNLFYQKITKTIMSLSFAQIFALYKNKTLPDRDRVRAAPLAWCVGCYEIAWSSSSPSSSPWGAGRTLHLCSPLASPIACAGSPAGYHLSFLCIPHTRNQGCFRCPPSCWNKIKAVRLATVLK